MGRVKGSKNKQLKSRPSTSSLSPHERIRYLANLMIDCILEDQKNGQSLLNKINKQLS